MVVRLAGIDEPVKFGLVVVYSREKMGKNAFAATKAFNNPDTMQQE